MCEVGPRDGLQTEPRRFAVEERIELIDRLAATGVEQIEAVSFVNPKRVPQMAGAEEVMAGIDRSRGTAFAGLVLNTRGVERALRSALDEIRFAVLATETFNRRNQGASVDDSLAAFADSARLTAESGIRFVGIVSAAFGCPFEGQVPEDQVMRVAKCMVDSGATGIVFADTIGAAVPSQVRDVFTRARKELGDKVSLGGHFHNTRNTGFANAVAALGHGADVLDSSIGGLGGCPFAPGATGNVASEDMAYMLRNMNVETGARPEALVDVVLWLEEVIGRTLPGQLARAGCFPECAVGTA